MQGILSEESGQLGKRGQVCLPFSTMWSGCQFSVSGQCWLAMFFMHEVRDLCQWWWKGREGYCSVSVRTAEKGRDLEEERNTEVECLIGMKGRPVALLDKWRQGRMGERVEMKLHVCSLNFFFLLNQLRADAVVVITFIKVVFRHHFYTPVFCSHFFTSLSVFSDIFMQIFWNGCVRSIFKLFHMWVSFIPWVSPRQWS